MDVNVATIRYQQQEHVGTYDSDAICDWSACHPGIFSDQFSVLVVSTITPPIPLDP